MSPASHWTNAGAWAQHIVREKNQNNWLTGKHVKLEIKIGCHGETGLFHKGDNSPENLTSTNDLHVYLSLW